MSDTAATGKFSSALPMWHPAWAQELAELYFSGTTCLFLIHGNVHDLIRCPLGQSEQYCNLTEFLSSQVFGSWDIVLQYDLGRGLRPLAGSDQGRLQSMMQFMTSRLGDPMSWPAEPDRVLQLLDRFIERSLLDGEGSAQKRIAIVLDYAQYLVPAGDLNALARGAAANLVRLLSWAQNPYIKRVNIAICLVAEKLAEVNERLTQNPHVATIEVPLPNTETRAAFAHWSARQEDFSKLTSFSPEALTELSNGLSLMNLNVVLSRARQTHQPLDAKRFKQLKKTMIERQCQSLVEFVEPSHTLDLVVGQEAAKQRLQEDAQLVLNNRLELAPMGYLLCGPVGTGKTFLAECYAGSIGIPCVKLRNFRSKYVGETEGNLEQVLNVLRSLGPVVVIIDEADAALGNRSSEGDSGTSSRVFSMIASQMGDTAYRGRIIWMLLTSRPDLLPIDIKRQGRAETHIPMFYPQTENELREMVRVMARKNKLSLNIDSLGPLPTDRQLSGADIESVVLTAQRSALAAGRNELSGADIAVAISDFIPSAQGLEKEMQELAAVLECTQLAFLPPFWRDKVAQPDGRGRLQERLAAVRELIG